MDTKFKYFIADEDNNFYYVENGIVMKQGAMRALEVTPDGFQDIAIAWERNLTYWGLVRNFSFPLGFVKDGAKILNHLYHSYGVACKSYVLIYKSKFNYTEGVDGGEHYFNWDEYYKGEIDFTTFDQEEFKTTVALMDGGIEALIKARENTEYEIEIVKEAKVIEMDGIELHNSFQGVITDGMGTGLNDTLGSHIVDVQIVSKEVEGIGGVKTVERTKVNNVNAEIKATGSWIFKATSDGVVRFDYDFILSTKQTPGTSISPGYTLGCVLRVIPEAGTVGRNGIVLLERSFPLAPLGSFHLKGGGNVQVNNGDEVYLYTYFSPSGSTGDGIIDFNYSGEGLIVGSYVYKHPKSNITSITALGLFRELIDKISDGKYPAESAYLEGRRDIVFSSGDYVRGVEDARIKISLSDFWKTMRGLGSTDKSGLFLNIQNVQSIEGSIRDVINDAFRPPGTVTKTPPKKGVWIAQLSELFDSSQPIDIGTVASLKVKPAVDLIYGTVKTGYANQNYEDVNGRSEFNSGQSWITPITRSSKTYENDIPARADSIGIEYLRINFEGKQTTDSSADNDIVILHTKKNPKPRTSFGGSIDLLSPDVYELDRSMPLSGVISPSTMFNQAFSPRQNMLNNGRLLHSVLDKNDDKEIRQTSADKNKNAIVNGVAENKSIVIGDLPDKLFLPTVVEFETYKPTDLMQRMATFDYKNQCIKFKWSDKEYTGFVLKCGIAPEDNEVQVYQVLLTPETNTLDLS